MEIGCLIYSQSSGLVMLNLRGSSLLENFFFILRKATSIPLTFHRRPIALSNFQANRQTKTMKKKDRMRESNLSAAKWRLFLLHHFQPIERIIADTVTIVQLVCSLSCPRPHLLSLHQSGHITKKSYDAHQLTRAQTLEPECSFRVFQRRPSPLCLDTHSSVGTGIPQLPLPLSESYASSVYFPHSDSPEASAVVEEATKGVTAPFLSRVHPSPAIRESHHLS